MDDRVVKFRVGVLVISTVILAGILILWFGEAPSIVQGTYTIHIHFSDAPGVTDGTPVRKSGILIGRVTKVEFAPQGGVNVTAKIDGNVKLYRNEIPQVSGSLLGGDVVIQFIRRSQLPAAEQPPPAKDAKEVSRATSTTLTGDAPSDPKTAGKSPPPESSQQILPDDYIEGTVAQNPFQVFSNMEGELGRAVGSLSNAGDEVGKLASRINSLLDSNDEQINRIVSKTEQTLDLMQKSLASFDDVFGNADTRQKMRDSIDGLPQLFADTRETMNTIKTTVESVDRNLRNLEGFTGPLGNRGEDLVSRVDQTMIRLDEFLSEMSDFGRKLNTGGGSLGKIMSDPELYQHLNAAAKNFEQITCQLKPILADARVFSDKIARHPEVLGVRGAIKKSPGFK